MAMLAKIVENAFLAAPMNYLYQNYLMILIVDCKTNQNEGYGAELFHCSNKSFCESPFKGGKDQQFSHTDDDGNTKLLFNEGND